MSMCNGHAEFVTIWSHDASSQVLGKNTRFAKPLLTSLDHEVSKMLREKDFTCAVQTWHTGPGILDCSDRGRA